MAFQPAGMEASGLTPASLNPQQQRYSGPNHHARPSHSIATPSDDYYEPRRTLKESGSFDVLRSSVLDSADQRAMNAPTRQLPPGAAYSQHQPTASTSSFTTASTSLPHAAATARDSTRMETSAYTPQNNPNSNSTTFQKPANRSSTEPAYSSTSQHTAQPNQFVLTEHVTNGNSRLARAPLPTPPNSNHSEQRSNSLPTTQPSQQQQQVHSTNSLPVSAAPRAVIPLPTPPESKLIEATSSRFKAPAMKIETSASTENDYSLPLQFSPVPPNLQTELNRARKSSLDREIQQRANSNGNFYGIPGGRLAQQNQSVHAPQQPAQRASGSSQQQRQSSIPSFVPAAAFSAEDRGPYPPHVSPSRERASFAMDGAYPNLTASLSANKGKNAVDQEEILEHPSSFKGASTAGAIPRNGEEFSAQENERVPQIMTGVGRNSLLRNSLAASPQFLGPAPISPTGDATSPVINSVQLAQQLQYTTQPPRAVSAGPQPPPHLIPQPEVCVECMMRDRDMMDVHVTGEGMWSRDSDADFEEAMRLEMDQTASESLHYKASDESGHRQRASRKYSQAGSRESVGGKSSNFGGGSSRRKLGKGQALTSASLKLWTNMNPPASAHRWRTLQTFLATQISLIEADKAAKAGYMHNNDERSKGSRPQDVRQSAPALMNNPVNGFRASRTSSLLPTAKGVEASGETRTRDRTSQDEYYNQYRTSKSSLQPNSIPQQATTFHPQQSSDQVKIYSHGDQPWLKTQVRRFSSPGLKDSTNTKIGHTQENLKASSIKSNSSLFLNKFTRSSTDLRPNSIQSQRSLSPGRNSLGVEDAQQRTNSTWSARFRQSASQSVLSFAPSFAPSASLMEMHVGLSMDRHQPNSTPYETYPSHSDTALNHANTRGDALRHQHNQNEKPHPKKKGIKQFFSKLVGGNKSNEREQNYSQSAVESTRWGVAQNSLYDSDELAPPPPLSALVNEARYHQRSGSVSSIDSTGGPFTPPAGVPTAARHLQADRASVMTANSFQSNKSKPKLFVTQTRNSLSPELNSPVEQFNPQQQHVPRPSPPLASPHLVYGPRSQKSLPCLPSEAQQRKLNEAYPFPHQTILTPPTNLPFAETNFYTGNRSSVSLQQSREWDTNSHAPSSKSFAAKSKKFSASLGDWSGKNQKKRNGQLKNSSQIDLGY